MTKERMICEHHTEKLWAGLWIPIEPAPPKDWKEQMYELELRNARLSRFIMDWLGRELDIQNEDGVISITDLLPFRKLEENCKEQCREEFEDDDGMGTFICDRPKDHGGLHESASWQRSGEAPLRTQVTNEEQNGQVKE